MKILITNFHSVQNKGDLGIVLGLMAGLKTKWPKASFSLIGRQPDEREWWANRGINFYQPVLTYQPTSRLAFLVFLFKFWQTLRTIRTSQSAVLEAYREADLVISKGGSFFREPEYKRNWLPVGILGHLHQLLIAKKLGKPIVLSAQSFGPINNPITRLILRRVFRRLALITVRDGDSARWLGKVLKIKNVPVVGDSAFLLKSSPATIKLSANGKPIVGLTVRTWGQPQESKNYRQAIIALIEHYAGQFQFVFMPQVIGPKAYEDDRLVAEAIVDQLSVTARLSTMVIKDDLSPSELIDLYHQTDFFIATRLHSAIFALLASRPVLAIGYEPKTAGVLGDLGLDEWVIDIRSINAKVLSDCFASLLEASGTVFSRATDQARVAANKNIDLISDLIK